MKGRELGPGLEFDLIRRFLEGSAAPGAEVVIGPGDDCAVIEAGRLALTADLSLEGVHFRRDWLAPEEIGYRATAASLSDLAAMAAAPVGVLASLAVTVDDLDGYAERLMAGVLEAVEEFGGTLLGGDLVRTPGPVTIDIVALGRADRPVLRSGASPGDEIWVTGTLGGAAAAVEAWLAGAEPGPEARLAYARPRPRIEEARWLAERGAVTALLDISDGIAGDLRHLATASEIALLIDPVAVPVHPAAAATEHGLRLALQGGEDYELCFASPAGVAGPLAEAFEERFGVGLHRIGEVVAPAAAGGDDVARSERAGESRAPGLAAGTVAVRNPDGTIEPLEGEGFMHFHRG